MMAYAVKRILNHTYIAVPAGGEAGAYGRNILAANRISGLLDCRAEHLDGKTVLLFDVTSRQSLKVFLGKRRISADFLRTILAGILTAAENLEEYLLDPGHFVLRPEYVFLDAAAKETGLVYDAGFTGDFFESLKELAGFFLENIPEDDHEAILLAYRFSHELDAPTRNITSLLDLISAENDCPPSEDLYAGGTPESFRPEDDIFEARPEKEEPALRRETPDAEKGSLMRRSGLYAAAVAGGVFCLALLIYAARTLLPAYPAGAALCLIPAAGVLAALVLILRLRKKKKSAGPAQESDSGEGGPEEAFPDRFSDLYAIPENASPDRYLEDLFVPPSAEDGGPETRILSGVSDRNGRMARLIPEDAAAGFKEIRLSGAETRIGKLADAVDAVIPSPVVSRIHARVIRRENGWFLEDLNSRNGTYVNGKITAAGGTPLADGDRVRFADAGFVFRTGG